MSELTTIGIAIISAIVYAVIAYAKTQGESFDELKFSATIIVGACIGIASYMSNNILTQQTMETQLVAYAGVTAIVENICKAIYRKIVKKTPTPPPTPPSTTSSSSTPSP